MFSHWKAISWALYAEICACISFGGFLCFLNEGINKNSSHGIFSSSFCPLRTKKKAMKGFFSPFSASAVLVSFTAGGCLSGAVGCHQGNKRHNVMRRHINESKCQRWSRFWQVKNTFHSFFFAMSSNYIIIEFLMSCHYRAFHVQNWKQASQRNLKYSFTLCMYSLSLYIHWVS